MLTVTIHQPEFLPWLGFMDKLRQSDVAVVLDSVQFRKNYFQNRNRIRGAAGTEWLTVPVFTENRSDQKIRDVRICRDRNWSRKHLRALAQHYGRAPFFSEYESGLRALYERSGDSLVDLNESIILWMARAFGIGCGFVRSSSLSAGGDKTDLLLGICRAVGADVYLSGPSGRDYLDESRFSKSGIQVRYNQFVHPSYSQQYAPFIPMLSGLDLLFNHGPEARTILTTAPVETGEAAS